MTESLCLEAVDALRAAPPLAAVRRLHATTLVHPVRATAAPHRSLGKLGQSMFDTDIYYIMFPVSIAYQLEGGVVGGERGGIEHHAGVEVRVHHCRRIL